MLRYIIVPAFLAVSACSQTGPVVTPDTGAPCGADRYQSLIGMGHEDLLKVEILGPVRIIRPGTAVTMDFIENRLNIELDDAETVTRVYCG